MRLKILRSRRDMIDHTGMLNIFGIILGIFLIAIDDLH